MASLFLIPLFTINHLLLVFCPSWSLTAFPGHRWRATNKAMLPASETVQEADSTAGLEELFSDQQ